MKTFTLATYNGVYVSKKNKETASFTVDSKMATSTSPRGEMLFLERSLVPDNLNAGDKVRICFKTWAVFRDNAYKRYFIPDTIERV